MSTIPWPSNTPNCMSVAFTKTHRCHISRVLSLPNPNCIVLMKTWKGNQNCHFTHKASSWENTVVCRFIFPKMNNSNWKATRVLPSSFICKKRETYNCYHSKTILLTLDPVTNRSPQWCTSKQSTISVNIRQKTVTVGETVELNHTLEIPK